ncbi:MAG: hypothetical protein D6780_04445, partial [Candidatus Dadabacteria bacterium]
YWKAHIENSSLMQINNLTGINSLLIIGAGNLIDCPIKKLLNLVRKITLLDLDPACRSLWAKYGFSRTSAYRSYLITDITNCLFSWSIKFEKEVSLYRREKALKKAEELLFSFCQKEIAVPLFNKFEAVVSLNILSQLFIYFSEKALSTLLKCKVLEQSIYNSEVIRYLDIISKKIENHHLKTCFSLAKKKVIIISDKLFIYYQAENPLWEEVEAVRWDFKTAAKKGWRLKECSSWYWNIVPLNTEIEGGGRVNLVKGSVFEKETYN